MPNGKIVYFNANRGLGRIETKSGSHPVNANDMAPDARVEGAYVDFDVVKDKPQDRAVNVRLREGTRNAPSQNRFGDTG